MSIKRIPTAGVPLKQVAVENIWNAPEPNDRQVWGVCVYMRGLKRCQGCPAWEEGPYGPEKRGCRALAEEACRVVMAAQTDREEPL
jgi:hypothetical protein